MSSPKPTIRPMTEHDIPRLADIRAGFVSPTVLTVEITGSGMEMGWRLVERKLIEPYDKGNRYDFDRTEQANIRTRMRQDGGLYLVVEQAGRLVGILDATPHEWNNTVWVWNLMLDKSVRRQGIGRALFCHAVGWARKLGYRALVFETQTNNVPACKFYARMGCQLDGLRTSHYTNNDRRHGEVALFWMYRLSGPHA
ncbi:MAG: GNAT family N-acetyltransferase [Anaerolineae bacterium]|nr:GNAT family N-acetyltransferase [Anaerolineae bacterium]